MSKEEDLMVLQDVLDEIVGGRTDGHACPFCSSGTLSVSSMRGVYGLNVQIVVSSLRAISRMVER